MKSKFQFFRGKSKDKMLSLQLSYGEADEICCLLESILRDNTPQSEQLEGEELVTHCLLHNDPETFRERNKAFSDAMEQFGQLQGLSFEPEQETFQDAEEEYSYLALVANIYYKIFNANQAA